MPLPVPDAAKAEVGNRLRIVIISKNAETSLVLIDFIKTPSFVTQEKQVEFPQPASLNGSLFELTILE